MSMCFRLCLSVLSGLVFQVSLNAAEARPVVKLDAWPAGVREVEVRSTADGSMQPSLFRAVADAKEARPLLVGLHTWSGDYTQASNGVSYARWCEKQGWHFIYPNFRGPNRTPQALGSKLAVQDVVDAVAYARQTAKVDEQRIYLIGVSGGGHMALLMAGRHPEIWAGVSAWCGIGDVAAWHQEHVKGGKPDNYARHIEAALGGPPDVESRLADVKERSPLTWLAKARGVPLDICHGIHDGRTGSVPFRHSLLAFNEAAGPAGALPAAEIAAYYESQTLPAGWPAAAADPLYGEKKVLFRKSHENTRVTVFEGGHEIIYLPGLNWLAAQRKGQPTVWQVKAAGPVDLGDTKSGL